MLLHMPRMLRDLVREVVAGEPDLEVVGEIDDESQLRTTMARAKPDFVIVGGERAELSPRCRALFDERPRLKVLALAGQGESGVVWELAPHRIPLGEMSPSVLLSAIRNASEWRWDA